MSLYCVQSKVGWCVDFGGSLQTDAQYIAFRGDHEDASTMIEDANAIGNPENFLAHLKNVSKSDDLLRQ